MTDTAATTELLLAVAAGDVARVTAALADGADVNARNEADATPLDVACGEAHVDMVACLLLHPTLDVAKASPTLLWTLCKRGARGLITQLLGHPTTDPMALQPDRYNLLIALCSESHLTEMLSLFLHHPRVDWNASVDDMTPLQRAVEFRHWESVVVLLQDPRVDINATLHDQTLLHAAVLADRVDLVTMLLRHPRIDRRRLMTYQGTAFALAITNESDTFLELFLSIPDDDINVPAHGGATPLHQAITYLSDATTANRLLREPHLRRDAPDAKGNTALHLASQRGWTSLVEALLDDNVNVLNTAGDTPASVALLANEYDLALRFFCDFGADINTVMSNGLTPLLFACQHGQMALVQALLASPSRQRDVKDPRGNSAHMLTCYSDPRVFFALQEMNDDEILSRNKVGRTIFHVACEYGRETVVAALVRRSLLDVNAPDTAGNTPLMLACKRNHGAVVTQLLAHPRLAIDATNKGGLTALHETARAGHVRLLRLLLESTTTTVEARSAAGITPLMEAVDQRKPGVVTFLLRQPTIDANAVDNDGNTAFMRHCMHSDYDVLEALLSSPEVDINRRNHAGMTALALACHANDPMLAAQLMQLPQLDVATIDASCGHIALAVACALQYDHVVRKLLSSPEIDVNYRDASGLTALLQVCLNQGNVKIVQLLLEKPEIDTSVRDKHGNSALILATRQGNTGIVQALLAHGGCDVNAANDAGTTALHVASGANATDLVRPLLRARSIDVNSLDKKGQTPLMVACLAAADAVINLLLDHPLLRVSTSGNEHAGPLQTAVRRNAIKIVTRLVQHPTTVVDGRDEAGFSAWLRAVNDQNIPLLKALAAGVDVNLALVVPDRAYDFDPMLAWMQTIHPDSFEADDLRYMNPKIQWVASTNRHECTDATVASCKGGKTALMVACLYSNEAMVECLLSQPTIDLNAVDDDGNTALMHVAFLHPTAERIWHRLCQNAHLDVTKTNTRGETAIEIAGRCGSGIATAYLLQQLLSRRHPSVLPEIVEAVAAFFVGHGRPTTVDQPTHEALTADALALE